MVEGFSTVPSFLSFDSSARSISIETSDSKYIGAYEVFLIGTLIGAPFKNNVNITWGLNISKNIF